MCAKTSHTLAKIFFSVSDEFQYFTVIATFVEMFEPIACIIAEILRFLFTAYRNRDSQNGNVYTRNVCITTIAMSVFEVATRTKDFLGFKVAGYTFYGTFMPYQS